MTEIKSFSERQCIDYVNFLHQTNFFIKTLREINIVTDGKYSNLIEVITKITSYELAKIDVLTTTTNCAKNVNTEFILLRFFNSDEFFYALFYQYENNKNQKRISNFNILLPNSEQLDYCYSELKQELLALPNTRLKEEPYFNMLAVKEDSIDLEKIKLNIENLILQDNTITLNYGQDFYNQEHPHILDFFNSKKPSSRLVFLSGTPGTGKTTYIRYLIQLFYNQYEFIVVNNRLFQNMTSPQLFSIVTKSDKEVVFILEEAEDLIKNRKINSNIDGVSTLLNLGDGLISDAFRSRIICTFNNNGTDIVDQALTRPGRLHRHVKFEALKNDDLRRLSQYLKLDLSPEEIKQGLTLAQVYNKDNGFKLVEKNTIGFRSS